MDVARCLDAVATGSPGTDDETWVPELVAASSGLCECRGVTRRKPLVILCVVLAVAFVFLAIVYFTQTAQDLPGFLPGHTAGSTKHHTKHGIAMIVLAVFSVAAAWMLSGSLTKSDAGGLP